MKQINNVISQKTMHALQDLYTNGNITQDQFINMIKALLDAKS